MKTKKEIEMIEVKEVIKNCEIVLTHSSNHGWRELEPSQFLDIIEGDFEDEG